MRRELTEKERWTIINGCSAAATKVLEDAKLAAECDHPDVAETLLRTASEYNLMAIKMQEWDVWIGVEK